MAKAQRVMLIGLDGADPHLIAKYIKEGKLPNIRRFIEGGVTTEGFAMQGVLPVITPPNWASQATGALPLTHGITCFWNHTSGNELDFFDYGFNSGLLKAETIWEAFTRSGKKSVLFNYPTAWPPKNDDNIYVDGTSIYTNLRGYIDYEKIYKLEEGDFPLFVKPHRLNNSGESCRVEGDIDRAFAGISKEGGAQEKTDEYEGFGYTQPGLVTSETNGELSADLPNSDYIRSPLIRSSLRSLLSSPQKQKNQTELFAVLPVNNAREERRAVLKSNEDGIFDTVEIYGAKFLGAAKTGKWSDWIFDVYTIDGKERRVAYKIRVLELDPAGKTARLYLSFVLDIEGGKYFKPEKLGAELYGAVGPMLQPINYDRLRPAADKVAVESLEEMYVWHVKALEYILSKNDWNLLYIHMHGIDMYNHFYLDHTYEQSSPDFRRYQEQIYESYRITDDFVGKIIDDYLDGNTAIILTSDHAGVGKHPRREIPLIGDSWGISVGIMSELGYTVLKEEGGQKVIDWTKTRAISQRTSYIYLNVKGRDPQGIVDPALYDELVTKIIDDLYAWRDPHTGKRVIAFALNKNDMELAGLGGPHCGDIFFVLEPEFTRCHGNGLSNHTLLGYSMKSFFAAAGAGLKKGVKISRRVRAIDIAPTLCHLAGVKMPRDVEGGVIYQALDELDE
ncbi:MAG: alkaline phosphatase family protein [Spirochaetaceae bacterium]|jgi:predicted AlkP superfamily phosphohydrolase/phosphomutase|nr:alkaline phosphatase family protein [Spirochaetaceae bacterium]